MANPRMPAIYDLLVKKAPLCLLLVTLVMASGVTPVTAECITVDAWRAATVKGSPAFDIGQAEPMGAPLLALVTANYNATPPISHVAPDSGFMLMGRLKSNGMPIGDAAFGLFRGACLVATFITPLPHGRPVLGEPI
jgi:hypothetical protein